MRTQKQQQKNYTSPSPATQRPQHSSWADWPADNPPSVQFSWPEASPSSGRLISTLLGGGSPNFPSLCFPGHVNFVFCLSIMSIPFPPKGDASIRRKMPYNKVLIHRALQQEVCHKGGVWRFIIPPHFQLPLATTRVWMEMGSVNFMFLLGSNPLEQSAKMNTLFPKLFSGLYFSDRKVTNTLWY